MSETEDRLFQVFKERAVLRGEFTLSSGARSSYYFDGRMVTLWPEGVYLIGKKVLDLVVEAGAQAVGGPTIGADPMVAAVALVSHLEGRPVPAFIVRGEAKAHGTQKEIEGPLEDGARVALVDDVVTTGGSLLRAIAAVEERGCRVVKVVALLDRQQGGSEEIRRRGYDFVSLLVADPTGELSFG